MISITNNTDILANRISVLEIEVARYKKILELMQIKVDTMGLSNERGKFASKETLGEEYLKITFTPEEIAQLKSSKRHDSLTQLRRQVIVELYKRGLNPNQIARVLLKDHNAIYYHLILAGVMKPNSKFCAMRLRQRQAKMRLKANRERLKAI